MQKYVVTLKSGADYDATKRSIERQGGQIVDDSMRILGMITVQMSDPSLLKSLTDEIVTVEPDHAGFSIQTT